MSTGPKVTAVCQNSRMTWSDAHVSQANTCLFLVQIWMNEETFWFLEWDKDELKRS